MWDADCFRRICFGSGRIWAKYVSFEIVSVWFDKIDCLNNHLKTFLLLEKKNLLSNKEFSILEIGVKKFLSTSRFFQCQKWSPTDLFDLSNAKKWHACISCQKPNSGLQYQLYFILLHLTWDQKELKIDQTCRQVRWWSLHMSRRIQSNRHKLYMIKDCNIQFRI